MAMSLASGSISIIYDADRRNDPYYDEYKRARDLIEIDIHQASEHLVKLSHQGSIMSILLVADAMRDGTLYDRDLCGAERWYKVAVESGSVRGLVGLALTHLLMGRVQDAVRELESAIELGYPPAMNALAGVLFRGDGGLRDEARAFSLWRRAARLGHIHAKRHLISQSWKGKLGWRGLVESIPLYITLVVDVFTVMFRDRYSDRLR